MPVFRRLLTKVNTYIYKVSQKNFLQLIFESLSLGGVFLRVKNNSKNFETKMNIGLFRGNLKKKSLFKDIIPIKVDHPPSYPIFDKSFFDKF